MIRQTLQRHLPQNLLVAGELSNVSRPASGHLYFTLKDAGSEVRCAMWRSAAATLRFDPADGLAVLATGSVDVYEPRGQVQFYVRRLEPRGVGALELAFRQLREKLAKEGLFDPRRKRPLPAVPRRVAVVTSPTGAAIRDIVQTIRRRFACIELLVYPVRVQGDGAAEEIAAAIRAISRGAVAFGGLDVLIVGRGGGSLEDLWAFNTEIVARAIHACCVPVVSAVGHEIDVSISDLVADVRAATPTAAAELVVPVRAELLAGLDATAARLRRSLAARLESLRARLERMASTELYRDPQAFLQRREQMLDEAAAHLRAAAADQLAAAGARLHRAEVALWRNRPEAVLARRRECVAALEHRLRWAAGHVLVIMERQLEERWRAWLAASPGRETRRLGAEIAHLRGRLARASRENLRRGAVAVEGLSARLAASDHRRVLARGFSITRDRRTRRIIADASAVHPGDRIVTETAQGQFDSRVIDARQGELF